MRRTPTTSTTAWSAFCESSSTIFPGIARHTMQLPLAKACCGYPLAPNSFLPSRYELKIEFQLVLQSQRSACKRERLDPVVRLPQREFAGNSQHRSHGRNAGVKGMRLRNAVKRELTGRRAACSKSSLSFWTVTSLALIHRGREAFYFQNFLIHLLFEFLAIIASSFRQELPSRWSAPSPERVPVRRCRGQIESRPRSRGFAIVGLWPNAESSPVAKACTVNRLADVSIRYRTVASPLCVPVCMT